MAQLYPSASNILPVYHGDVGKVVGRQTAAKLVHGSMKTSTDRCLQMFHTNDETQSSSIRITQTLKYLTRTLNKSHYAEKVLKHAFEQISR